MRDKAPWWIGAVLALLGLAAVAACGWFVWPTPWKRFGPDVPDRQWREHRLDGEVEVRYRTGLRTWSEWAGEFSIPPYGSAP